MAAYLPKKAKGTSYKILCLLCVEDGTFLFDSREALEEGANQTCKHFARFGLKMHIGHEGGKSKTEAMCISPSLKEDEEKSLEPNLEPKIPAHNGFITLTEDFRCLGSIISRSLRDELEITTRFKKATAQFGALRQFFWCPHIQISTMGRVFVAIRMRFLGNDRENAEKVESFLSQEHPLNSQHKHAQSQSQPHHEGASAKEIPLHPRHHRCRSLQATEMDRKGGQNGGRESPTTPRSIMVQQPKKRQQAATRSPKLTRGGHHKGHPRVTPRRQTPGVDTHCKKGASLEQRHREMVDEGHSQLTQPTPRRLSGQMR
jgi:hypothetical protein